MEVLTRCTTCAAFFLTFLFAIANCQSPTLSGNGLYFVEGQTRVMLCYVTTADNPANFPLTWEKNGQVLNASSQSVNPNSGFYQYISYLNLPVQASDNGQSLTCKYQNQSPGASWIIYVKRAPDYPSLSGKTNVTWGMTYNWTCTVGGATSLSESDVRWQFGNGTTITSGITSTLSNATYSYNITTFTVTKVLTLAIPRGNLDFSLLCSVNHELLNNAPREGTLSVSVFYPPVVTTATTNYTVTTHSTATLTCQVSAQPAVASVTWYKDGGVLSRTSGRFQNGDTTQPSLVVTNVQKEDGGQYICSAANSLGGTNGSAILLTVLYPPEVTYNTTVFGARVGESVTLLCVVDAKPGANNVTWWRVNITNGVRILLTPASSAGKYSGGTATTPSLTINNLTAADTSYYRCGASNDVGSGEGTNVQVQVFYAPTVTVSATSYTRNETDVLVITCSYDANPTPVNVTWTRNSQSVDVAASGGKYSGSSVASPSLTVTGLTRSDAGLYVCAVTNTIGTGRSPDVTVDVNYSPVVHSPVVYYNGSRGGSVTLKCEVTANPAPTAISWYKDRSLVNISESNGKYTGGTTSTPDLTINSLSGSDGGSFFCRASNSLGSTDGNDIRLEVTYAPLITSGSAPRTATELSTLTLPCAYDANPVPSRILWAKNSTTITLPSPSYSGASPGNPSLTILSLSPEDTGSYVCTVVNSLGNASSGAIMLTVQYAPRVDSGLDSQKTSLAGQNVTIPCNVTAAVPAVTLVTWLRDGAVFPVSNGTKYGGGTVGTPPLTILRVASSDAATYTCRVTNDVGTREGRNVTLIVQYKPEVFVPQSLTGVESQTLSLECRVAADPAVTSVRWKKDGKLLDTSDSARFSGGNVSTPSLTISGLGAGDAGNYSCTADNSVGSTESANVTLSVQYSPVFTVPQTEVVGVVGQDVNLSISVRAYPEVTTLLWYKRDPASSALNQIDVRLSKYSGGVAGSPSLIITQLNSTDSGVYVAEAVNAVSTRRSPEITVVVSYPPAPPVISGQAGSYKEGEQIVMTCTSGAFPTPVYDWYRDSIVYRQNSSVLNISSATADDNSQFKCRAYNSLGYSETTVTVVVQYKPRPSLTLSNVTATSGNPVTLSCDTDANPPPTNFTWYFAGRVVSTGSRTLTVVVNASTTGTYTCIASNSQGDSGPVDVVVTPDAGGGDTGNTGASTNTGGISVATLVLIIIICIIFVVAVVLVVVYVCSGSRCSRKKNEVSQAPLATALTLPHVAPSKNGAAKLPPPRKAPPHAKISVNDDADVPPSPPPSPSTAAKAESQLGNGLIISLPGGTGGGPRPHRLPPLSSTGGAPREVEPAVDGDDENKKPTKKRRRKRQPEEEGLTSEPPTPQQSPQRQLQDDSVDV